MLQAKRKTRASYVIVAEDDPHFARFWAAYPKRVSKKEARLAWAQLNPTPEMVDKMVATLAWQCREQSWLRDGGQYIPYPASWLRAERWEDEPIVVQALSQRTMTSLTGAAEFVKGRGHGTD